MNIINMTINNIYVHHPGQYHTAVTNMSLTSNTKQCIVQITANS